MKQIRWTVIAAIAFGVWLGIQIASCETNRVCDPLNVETCEP